MYYSSKRQQFLIEQGYSFKVGRLFRADVTNAREVTLCPFVSCCQIITELADLDAEDLCFKTQKEELELLTTVLSEGDEASLDEVFEGLNGKGNEENLHVDELFQPSQVRPAARRTQGSKQALPFLTHPPVNSSKTGNRHAELALRR